MPSISTYRVQKKQKEYFYKKYRKGDRSYSEYLGNNYEKYKSNNKDYLYMIDRKIIKTDIENLLFSIKQTEHIVKWLKKECPKFSKKKEKIWDTDFSFYNRG